MTSTRLIFLSEAKLAELRAALPANLARYQSGDFLDLARENGWAIESDTVRVNVGALAALDGTDRSAQADVANSLIAYRAFEGMTPALAREERVWARLAHVECLEYARQRWFAHLEGDRQSRSIATHMFAAGVQGIRDDNAISRLWWNMHIATIADPDDPEGALRLLLQRADFRANLVERSNTGSRRPLVRAIVRAMRRIPGITRSEGSFRAFMRTVNREGGGVLFEALSDGEVDRLMDLCAADL